MKRTHELAVVAATLLTVLASMGFYVCTMQVPALGFGVGAGALAGLGFLLRDARYKDSLMETEVVAPKFSSRATTAFTKEFPREGNA